MPIPKEVEGKEKGEEDKPKDFWILHIDGSSCLSWREAGSILTSLDGVMMEYALKLDFKASKN